ncbi:MAG: metal ABC transporter ATP-binding protein [Treponema sp.]|jgi:zinc transport system ATP-binding protein|nr:metal ABC transporter ATP-binding protein [Treponema sp.]
MLINCKNVSFGYDGKAVVRNLNITVESGDYFWVVGENGSGKTTLIKGLLRLLTPLKGSIEFSDGLKHGRIGYLSQQSAPKKDFPAGVYEIVLSGNLGGMGLRPFYSAREKKLAEEAMEWLGIKNLAKNCYRELSGGQQRRVLLARALVSAQAEPAAETRQGRGSPQEGGDPIKKGFKESLLVLDEPTASLDPIVTVEVYELLKKLNEQTGITIIMVSHDTQAAPQYTKQIIYLFEGRNLSYGAEDYKTSDTGRKFFGQKEE